MNRNRIFLIAIFTVLFSGTAFGLDEIRVLSALNQPFVGEISLVDVPAGERDTAMVSLASEEEFRKVSREPHPFLQDFDFTPEFSRDGHAVIRATSSAPITEPYFDLVLVIESPARRFVKEYVVLLNLPQQSSRLQPITRQPRRVQSDPRNPTAKQPLKGADERNRSAHSEMEELSFRLDELKAEATETHKKVRHLSNALASLVASTNTQ